MNKIIIFGILFKLICGVALGEVFAIHDFEHARLYRCDKVNKLIVGVTSLKEHDSVTDIQMQRDSAILLGKGMEKWPNSIELYIVLENSERAGRFFESKIIPV